MADATCSVPNCTRKRRGREWCSGHYQRWRTTGDVQANRPLREPSPPTCSVPNCIRRHKCLGYCGKHYQRVLNHGDPMYGERERIDDCRVKGCWRPPVSPVAGVCRAHYLRLWRTGTTEPTHKAMDLPFIPACAYCGKANDPETVVARQHCSQRCYKQTRKGRQFRSWMCETCPAVIPAGTRGDRRFCDDCARGRILANGRFRAHRRRVVIDGLDGAAYERFDDREIFERDRWRCGLCRKRVNRRLNFPHPMSASLDHMVPIIEGGRHVRANVQLAHLACNVRKGERGGGEQLMLIG